MARCQSHWWQCSHWLPSFPPAALAVYAHNGQTGRGAGYCELPRDFRVKDSGGIAGSASGLTNNHGLNVARVSPKGQPGRPGDTRNGVHDTDTINGLVVYPQMIAGDSAVRTSSERPELPSENRFGYRRHQRMDADPAVNKATSDMTGKRGIVYVEQ